MLEDKIKDTIYLNIWYLPKVTLSIKVLIRDKEGNETTKKFSFDVDGTDQNKPKVNVYAAEDGAYLGEQVSLNLKADDRKCVNNASTEIELG